jgi:fructose-bisphosphate aldolase class II
LTVATLNEVLEPALRNGYAVAGMVVLGWEDARAFVDAAEAEKTPLILQAGPGCRAYTPLSILGKMFRVLAESASVPVVAHLDHGKSAQECFEAIDCGFTSVMFDGSRKPLMENIAETAAIVGVAHAVGVSVEGEVGFVGYSRGEISERTDPNEARCYELNTGVDALAISVGNVHLETDKAATIDFDHLRLIESVTTVPLVLHGGSGIPFVVRSMLSRTTKVCKFNIGTEMRVVFGRALRDAIARDPEEFDRIKLLSRTIEPMRDAARIALRALAPSA